MESLSVWRRFPGEDFLPQFPQLTKDIKTDVLIIGGGLAGILAAYFLREKGIDCVVAEKGRICGGTTGNTTAKITVQHGLVYSKLAKTMGYGAAEAYLRRNYRAFDKYAELCGKVECDYEVKDNYVYSRSNRRALEEEAEAVARIGYGAELCEPEKLPFKTAGAVRFSRQAQFHPLKFVKEISKELNIYENTFVRETANVSGGTEAVTDRGKVRADKIIVTTHFPFINKHGLYFMKLYQHRSYVIALDNAPDVNGMYVSDDNEGLSFRNYKNFLLLGGGGHHTGKQGGCWAELRDFAGKYYPEANEVCHWAAQDCMSLDGMPYIGQYSRSTPELLTASGFNKWGMTGAMLSAMILSDMAAGDKNELEELFDPSRSMLRPQLFANALESVKGLITVSPRRCPHLGCALKWNSAERSWDCPCHGSRFSEEGRVIDNPANGDL